MKRELELYVHIPFCVKKCAYCDFLSAPATENVQQNYIEVLLREIESSRELADEYEVSSVFLGGGTPSILPGEAIDRILKELKQIFFFREDAEITIECNPGTLTREKLFCYKKTGINRLSLGLQSADNEELRLLGRIHTWEAFLDNYHLAREAGFENINVDLMSALPGQTRDGWKNTLKKVLALKPEHISAYSLIIEEGTPFYKLYGEGEAEDCKKRENNFPCLPDEDTERQMYYDTKELLEDAGYYRYEISNYAKTGRECRHNLGYWRRVEYKGFGLGAASLLNNCRYRNDSDLKSYLQGAFLYEETEVLTEADILSETMFLGLRTALGVKLTGQMRRVYPKVLENYSKQGFLVEQDGYLCLTENGMDVSNLILAEFLLDQEELEQLEQSV